MPRRRSFQFPRRTATQVAADVEEELRFHLEMVTAELIDAGWLPEEARVEARRRFGDLEETRNYCCATDASKERQMKWMERLGELGQDLRFAGRQLWKSPGFTLVAALTLALGIGATTAIFSVVYGVVLRPLPFRAPERLVRPLFVTAEGKRVGAFSVPNFIDWKAASRAVEDTAALWGGTLNLSGGGEPERLPAAWVSANYFKVVGIRPLAGRTFAPGEDLESAPRVTVISEKLWRRRFGGDPGLVGRSITLDGQPHTVVGILRKGVQLPSTADAWVAAVFTADDLRQRGSVYFAGIGRLAPGATLRQAKTEADVIGRRLSTEYPAANASYFKTMTVEPLQDQMLGDTRKPLLILLGAVAFVLLIACANVANLLLVRAASREGEIVIRVALGAGRARIVRQLLTESLVLALAGGALGVALAAWVTKTLIALGPRDIPRLAEIGIDATTLLFALGISLLTGLLFGLAPALQTSRTDLSGVIRDGTKGSKGRGGTRARSLLVVAETALAVVLLAGAGLLIRSFSQLQKVDPGFKAERVVTFNLDLPEGRYEKGEQLRAFLGALQEKMAALPGVDVTGVTVDGMPFGGRVNVFDFRIAGRPPVPPGQEEAIRTAAATPDYFKAMSIRVVRGRAFTPRDRDGAPRVVVINEATARRYFPNQNPIGQRIDMGTRIQRGGEIVGIVADFKQDAMEQQIDPELFMPFDQFPGRSLSVVLRSTADPQTVVSAVQARVRELDPDLPVYDLQPMTEVVATATSQSRFYMLLLGGFAAIALVLAAVGIYGVIAYAVRQRTQEIGIRMALGASRDRVLRMVVGQGMTLALVGAAAGLAGAFVAARGLRSLLFEVSTSDPATYAGVALVLVSVAAVAAYLPARRAARTEPNLALKGEV
ncbi:MAG TPA: ABC transporter permease [Thermoanaerobaculia bacterium]|jgi:predicted permease|nr:ABC transporter permease [Thermoanaerobaculia bacterium]